MWQCRNFWTCLPADKRKHEIRCVLIFRTYYRYITFFFFSPSFARLKFSVFNPQLSPFGVNDSDKDDADLDDDKSDGVLILTVIIDDGPGAIVLTPCEECSLR